MTHLPELIHGLLATLWLAVVPLLVLLGSAVMSSVANLAVRAAALRLVVSVSIAWVHFYTRFLEENERDIRRADFRRHLFWGRYRRLRRRGYAGADVAVHLLIPIVKDVPGDVYEAASGFVSDQSTLAVYRIGSTVAIAKRRFGRLVGTPDRVRLQRALATLSSEHGYFVNSDRRALACCSNCGWTDVPDEARGAVFWNIQSDGYAFDGDSGYCDDGYSDTLKHALYLQWDGNGRLIVLALRAVPVFRCGGTAGVRPQSPCCHSYSMPTPHAMTQAVDHSVAAESTRARRRFEHPEQLPGSALMPSQVNVKAEALTVELARFGSSSRLRVGGAAPPAASRCSVRELAARFFPRRPPA